MLTANTVNDVRPTRGETTADSEPVSHADTVSSLSLTCWVVRQPALVPLPSPRHLLLRGQASKPVS